MTKTKKMVKQGLSLMMAAALALSGMNTTLAASSDPNASAEREARNAAVSQYAATQGMVLLENHDNVLPISQKANTRIALFGVGAYATIKGGTGSGDVYLKDGVDINVWEGFEKAGYTVVTNQLVGNNETTFLEDRKAEYDKKNTGSSGWGSYVHYETPYADDAKSLEEVNAAAGLTKTAVFVLTRNSGEGSDRKLTKGDYYLTDAEKENLTLLGQKFEKVIVVLNSGGIIDTNFFNGKGEYPEDDPLNRGKIEGLDSLVLMSQAGMNGGSALVQVLNGTYNPSGKLTDTWAINYEDYPTASTFSNNDGNTNEEIYSDDIYVGYRYFDTFGKDVAYEFGYGLSYTNFAINVDKVKTTADKVTVNATVTNTGTEDGKEVVEVYFSAPEGDMDKPYQELAAYQKVEVDAGKSEEVTLSFDTADMASYNEQKEAYILEDGMYTIRVGNSSRNTVKASTFTLRKDVKTEICANELGLTKDTMQSGKYSADYVMESDAFKMDLLDEKSEGYGTGITPTTDGLTVSKVTNDSLSSTAFPEPVRHTYTEGKITTYVSSNEQASDSYAYGKADVKKSGETKEAVKTSSKSTLLDVVNNKITMEQLVASMSNVELADLVEGGTYSGLAPDTSASAVIGSQADSVYGAAGETTSNLYNSRYIPNIVLSDGPAGIRITNSYVKYDLVSKDAAFDKDMTYYTGTYSWGGMKYQAQTYKEEAEFKEALKTNTLYTTDGTKYYQYCSAFPIGTLLAQTWDPEVITQVGNAVAEEMLEYGVSIWLAPGMNIHKNPLCGRNFEYYSEDPVVVGTTCAAMTNGVQIKKDGTSSGVGVSVKHFACNNQEAQRMGSNSVVSERAAREIYLRGFEIGCKEAQPMTIMSSYNQINGTSTFENYGLLTEIVKNEWGYNGFIETDWYSIGGVNKGSIHYGENVQKLLMYAGNDCEMPGGSEKNILAALEDGSLRLGDLQRSAIHMLNVIKDTATFAILKDKIESMPQQPEGIELNGKYALHIEGYDWGPAVSKLTVKTEKKVDTASINLDKFAVSVKKSEMNYTTYKMEEVTKDVKALACYASDKAGNKVSSSTTNYITFELKVGPSYTETSPFTYSFSTGFNTWTTPYEYSVTLKDSLTAEGEVVKSLAIKASAADNTYGLADKFTKGTFTNSKDGIKLTYGSYSPEKDNKKNSLIIWLHGAGEGGIDPNIVLLGNKSTNLVSDDIQNIFGGAYVLTPQAPTMWMDSTGNGNYTTDSSSIYTEALKALIDDYVAKNPDIDTNKIYIGGCSNGGFMTMNMILAYPDYFAAAYPVCEAYVDANITDSQIASIKDMPIWFTFADNDTTVNPEKNSIATYNRLIAAGAKNVYKSEFADVHDVTGLYTGTDGAPYQYAGHWSWIYTLNNDCEQKIDGKNITIMEWLAANSKEAEVVVTPTVKVDKTSVSLFTNQSQTVKATGLVASDSIKSWTSSNTKVATVDKNGKITAKKAGTAVVTVTTTKGATAVCKVTVKNATVKLNKTSIKIHVNNGSVTLKASGIQKGDSVKSWTTSDKKIATVDKNGKVTLKKAGTATITVTTKYGAKATCKIKVTNEKVAAKSIQANVSKVTLKKGQTFKLKITKNPVYSTDTLTFSSSKKSVATVTKSGTIKASKKGTAVITVKASSGKKTTVKVTVK